MIVPAVDLSQLPLSTVAIMHVIRQIMIRIWPIINDNDVAYAALLEHHTHHRGDKCRSNSTIGPLRRQMADAQPAEPLTTTLDAN